MKRRLTLTVFAILVFVATAFSASLTPEAVPRVTVKELESMLAGGRAVVILDLRSNGSYNANNAKIKGAIRIPPRELKDRMAEIPKGKKIVTYCT